MRKNHKFIQKKFVSLLSLILIMPAYADVENSYIVTFKKPEKGIPPIITIPNKADKGIYTVVFGENDSLQSRQAVANIISLKGEVVSIFDNINAVHLKIDSEEASRLSRDERVLLVEQDRLLTTYADVENSYIVTFKKPEKGIPPIITIPNKADKGIYTVVFGENDSLQSRQAVANIISLKGEVVSIFDNINAVHLKIDSEEASRLSRDERVLLVEQDRLLTTASTRQIDELSPYSEETPVLNGDTLIIPVIDTLKKSGEFQDVIFKFNDQGEWLLSDYKIGKEIGQIGSFEVIKNVEIIKTETFPIQIFLRVSGVFPSGCQNIGRIKHKLIENNFNVAIYYDTDDDRYSTGEMTCTMGFERFTRIIPLPVYGLQKGAYRYTVNGDFTGVFDLSSDNEL